VLLHVFDVSGPGIDERDVLSCLHHMGAGVSSDRTCSDNGYFPGHASHALILLTQRNPAGGSITTVEPRRVSARYDETLR
jgi:hypothetical protein